jgi:hypothetical protein
MWRVMVLAVLVGGTAWGQTTRPTYEELRAENDRLRREVASLRQQLAALTPPAPKRSPRVNTYLDNMKPRIEKAAVVGGEAGSATATPLSASDKRKAAATAKEISDRIEDYLATADVDEAIAAAMRAGEVVIGMTKEQMEPFGNLKLRAETAGGKAYTFIPWNPVPRAAADTEWFNIIVGSDGRVVRIDR